MSQTNDFAISIRNVSKTFKLPHQNIKSIKGLFLNVFRGRRTYEKQIVLENISFDIKKGEFFGIVGRNGSGKSTLLKLISGIYAPDEGQILVNGKLIPFIELGVGFNPELTGRENVYLNGALLGYGTKEMDEMYDEIVYFAELERFMDQKLNNYSSGMQVRLAFSIAIRAKADVLVLDEVLAVGDVAFQTKCYDYFKELKSKGQTVVFVSHDMQAVQDFCDRALFLKNGKIVEIGSTFDIARLYASENLDIHNKSTVVESHEKSIKESDAYIKKVETYNIFGKNIQKFTPEDKSVVLRMVIKSSIEIKSPYVGIAIEDSSGKPIVAFNTIDIGLKLDDFKPDQEIILEYEIQNIFNDGKYNVQANIKSQDNRAIISMQKNLHKFGISGRINKYGLAHPDVTVRQNYLVK